MDILLLKILVPLIGGIISILLVVVGFFLRQHINVVRELIKSVDTLSKVVAVLENNGKNATLNSNQRHFTIDVRLKTHGEHLDAIDIEIAKIKTVLKLNKLT